MSEITVNDGGDAVKDYSSLIAACEDRVRPAPYEYPIHDYPWGIREVGSMDELIAEFWHGNWSVRTGFVLGDLAFVEQVSGGWGPRKMEDFVGRGGAAE